MGRGKSRRSLELIEACHEILTEIQPATVRAVCYRLFTQRLIASMSKSNTNRVSHQLTEAREQGDIPWAWIVDETREPERVSSWANPAAFVATVRRAYRRDHWALQPHRVEVWSEKGTVRGTLAPVLEEYGVTFRVMHGYASATVVHEVAEQRLADPRPMTALYVGDWDPSGLHMSRIDLPTRLDEHRFHEAMRRVLNDQAVAIPSLEVQRVALSDEDVGEERDLPSFDADTKQGDSRWEWFTRLFGDRCWELDALSPVVLRDRVAAAIRALIDAPTWQRSVAAEQAEIASLRTVLDRWNGA
jgi:hypothetical protein